MTKIEAEDDAEAATYRRCVVAEVRVRPALQLDEIEEVHELIASLVDRHLCMVKGKPWMQALLQTPLLVLLPMRGTVVFFLSALPLTQRILVDSRELEVRPWDLAAC